MVVAARPFLEGALRHQRSPLPGTGHPLLGALGELGNHRGGGPHVPHGVVLPGCVRCESLPRVTGVPTAAPFALMRISRRSAAHHPRHPACPPGGQDRKLPRRPIRAARYIPTTAVDHILEFQSAQPVAAPRQRELEPDTGRTTSPPKSGTLESRASRPRGQRILTEPGKGGRCLTQVRCWSVICAR